MAQLTVHTSGPENRVQRHYTVTLHLEPAPTTAVGDALADVIALPESVTRKVSLWFTEDEYASFKRDRAGEAQVKLQASRRLAKLLAREIPFPFRTTDWDAELQREQLVRVNVERAENGRVISCKVAR